MPYKTEYVDPEVFMSDTETGLEGFAVFHTYIDDAVDCGKHKLKFTFHDLDDGCFNAELLPGGGEFDGSESDDEVRTVIRKAIHSGYFDKWDWDDKEPDWTEARNKQRRIK